MKFGDDLHLLPGFTPGKVEYDEQEHRYYIYDATPPIKSSICPHCGSDYTQIAPSYERRISLWHTPWDGAQRIIKPLVTSYRCRVCCFGRNPKKSTVFSTRTCDEYKDPRMKITRLLRSFVEDFYALRPPFRKSVRDMGNITGLNANAIKKIGQQLRVRET